MIVVGFSTQLRNPLSWVIRKFSGSKASHAWLLVYDPVFQHRMVMEATEVGFRLTAYEHFHADNDVVALVPLKHDVSTGLVAAAAWLGDAYNFVGLIEVPFRRWLTKKLSWIYRKIKHPAHSPSSLFCTQAVVLVLQGASYPGADTLDSDTTTPQELMDFLQSA